MPEARCDATSTQTTTSTLTWRNYLDHILARCAVNRGGHRVAPGLYALRRPDADSPVLVTANYSLSFDALRSSRPGADAHILVRDTHGINVWCAAGKGTFGTTELLERTRVPATTIAQSRLYALLDALHEHNEVYRRAGAVHGCALCGFADDAAPRIELFVEDVGRHNAADAIAGHMWLNDIPGRDKVFYTTGRLTSEMVVKIAQMGIPVLVSRSGITEKGLELARLVGVVMIARAKGRHFLVYNGAERVRYDAPPPR